ncbi:tyrosine-type recombinase/integrase [Nonomuraea bangladeshensis]|uniref:tyrosine-type recombinase/integrase n=1 Tax=Nonomuraea bangladeshensis TaxID=404385 RepID=UPI003C2ACB3A
MACVQDRHAVYRRCGGADAVTGKRLGKRCARLRTGVAVWTIEQLTEYLAFVRDDRLFALWWLITLRGLRRAEVAGLRRIDLDTDRRELTMPASLSTPTTACCRVRRRAPPVSVGALWTSTLSGFCTATNKSSAMTWASIGRRQPRCSPARTAGPLIPTTSPTASTSWSWPAAFPPVRLHDLRHGAATLALAAGADLRVVQSLLGHASIVLTADTYTSVLPQLYHESARRLARPRAR